MSKNCAPLPYGRQWIDDDDVAAVVAALRSDYLTTGPLVDEFEAEFAKRTGARFAVVCNSGTAALHLAVMACEVGAGDAVVVPTITFLATANVVRMTGADVIFADVNPDSGLMTAETLADALRQASGRSVKAAIPVHVNGARCAMNELADLADSNGMSLIEDACHALGVPDVGSNAHSRIACFSTHPVKAIATGEGGVTTTADAALARNMKRLRNHGMIREAAEFRNHPLAFEDGAQNPWYYEMHDVGWNYRQPDILCALGLSQLRKLDRFWRRRNEIAHLYDRLLASLAPIARPAARGNSPHGWHLYVLLIDFDELGIDRGGFMRALRQQGVGTQVHYIPVHRQPYYCDLYGSITLEGAERYYARCLSLPIFPQMTDDDVVRVADAIKATMSGGHLE